MNNRYAIVLRNLKKDQLKLEFGSNLNYRPTQGIPETDSKKYYPIYFSPNAISLSDQVQIVVRFHGTPEEIHSTFDFVHATNYFTFETGLVRNLEAIDRKSVV